MMVVVNEGGKMGEVGGGGGKMGEVGGEGGKMGEVGGWEKGDLVKRSG